MSELLRERPPVLLDSLGVASDARVDSAGYQAGSDTAFVAALMRRYRPDLAAAPDPENVVVAAAEVDGPCQ